MIPENSLDLVAEIERLAAELVRGVRSDNSLFFAPDGHVLRAASDALTRAAAALKSAWDDAAEWELECVEAQANVKRLAATVEQYEEALCLPDARPLVHPNGALTRDISPIKIGTLFSELAALRQDREQEKAVEGVIVARAKAPEYPSLGNDHLVMMVEEWPIGTPVVVSVNRKRTNWHPDAALSSPAGREGAER